MPRDTAYELLATDAERAAVTSKRPASARRWILLSASVILVSIVILANLSPKKQQRPRGKVGARSLPVRQPRRQCSPSQLLRDIPRASIRPDGASRTLPSNSAQRLDDFTFSFDLPSCDLLTYNTEQACDLVSAYGGLFLQGDSVMRHISNVFVMLLSGDTSAAVKAEFRSEQCTGDLMFREKMACALHVITSSDEIQLCDPARPIRWKYAAHGGADLFDWATKAYATYGEWLKWRETRPGYAADYSDIVLVNGGLHYSSSSSITRHLHLLPWLDVMNSSLTPPPLALWVGIDKPGENKPVGHLWQQGPDVIRSYDDAVAEDVERFFGDFTFEESGMKMIDTYGMTDSAASWDGTHYSFHVNMEKLQLILNVLDAAWQRLA